MNTSMDNGTQMTLLDFEPEMYQPQTCTVSDFHVRLSALQDSEEALKIHEELSYLTSCGLLKKDSLKFYSERMCRDFSIMGGYYVLDDHQFNGRCGVLCRMASA